MYLVLNLGLQQVSNKLPTVDCSEHHLLLHTSRWPLASQRPRLSFLQRIPWFNPSGITKSETLRMEWIMKRVKRGIEDICKFKLICSWASATNPGRHELLHPWHLSDTQRSVLHPVSRGKALLQCPGPLPCDRRATLETDGIASFPLKELYVV